MRKGLLLVLLCYCFGISAAPQRPNFSGTWKLNLNESDLGPLPAPKQMTLRITHNDPDLNVTTMITGGPQGDLNYDAKYYTDGKETTNRLAGHDARCTAAWDGAALVLHTDADFGGGNVKIESRWTLLHKGDVLKQSARVTTPQGNFDPTYVLDKETMR